MRPRFVPSLLVLCIILIFSHTAKAQNASRLYVEPDGWSVGVTAGISDLWGDIGTKSFMDHYTNSKYFDKMAFMGGMFGRYTIHPCLAVRMGINYGTLYASDKWNYDGAIKATSQGDDAYQRYARAQNVKDYMLEFSAMFEFMPFRMNPEIGRAYKRGQPWIGLGFGYFHFVPYSTVGNTDTWVKIHDLHLEGQDWKGGSYPKQFNLWQMELPLAIGYRWDLGEHLNLGIEYIYRMTFTDYLDGVSGKYVGANEFAAHMSKEDAQLAANVADKGYLLGLTTQNVAGNMRGNPSNKDSYSTLSITLFYKVLAHTRRWWR